MVSAVFFVATAGAMAVGWLPVVEGVVGLLSALLIATATAAKFYDGVHRTNLYALDLERTLPGGERLDESSVADRTVKTFSAIGLAIALLAGAGITAYSWVNADTQVPITSLSQAFVTEDERDDDDDDDDDDGGGDDDDGDDDQGGDGDDKDDEGQQGDDDPDPGSQQPDSGAPTDDSGDGSGGSGDDDAPSTGQPDDSDADDD